MSASLWLYSRNSSPSSAPESPRPTSRRTASRSRLARSRSEVVAGLVMRTPTRGPRIGILNDDGCGVALQHRNLRPRFLGKIVMKAGEREGLFGSLTLWPDPSRQLVKALRKSVQAERKSDALLWRLEDDEGRRLGSLQLAEQLVVHDNFGDAAVRKAAHEAGAPHVLVVELQAQSGGQQHAERRYYPHQPALLVGGLEHDHGQTGIGAVLCHHALDQGALLVLRAGRRVAADLPVAMCRAHRALRLRGRRRAERGGGRQRRDKRGGQSGASAFFRRHLARSHVIPKPFLQVAAL